MGALKMYEWIFMQVEHLFLTEFYGKCFSCGKWFWYLSYHECHDPACRHHRRIKLLSALRR
jgi:hypothetical protein